jgi:O-acetyl-ADP-ribose deacetylase (regulator of RNase III)
MLKHMKSNDDMFASSCQTIVNPVNCVGVMGAGLALQFRKRYPAMYDDYVEKCKFEYVKPGFPYLWIDDRTGKYIVNFPTKRHWVESSVMNVIETGLYHFVDSYKAWGITSVAFPALGSGCGGLRWREVEDLMELYLVECDIPVEIYPPH